MDCNILGKVIHDDCYETMSIRSLTLSKTDNPTQNIRAKWRNVRSYILQGDIDLFGVDCRRWSDERFK